MTTLRVRIACTCAHLVALTLLGVSVSYGQLQGGPSGVPEFSVASIKRSTPGRSRSDTRIDRGVDTVKLTIENNTLLFALEKAFGLREYQIAGPSWLSVSRFDIVAIAPLVSNKTIFAMLQHLLIARFQLTLRRDTRIMPVYALMVGKKGAKLKPADSVGESGTWASGGHLIAKKLTMDQFAELLAHETGRPVVNRTALDGAFDFELRYTKGDDTRSVDSSDVDPNVFAALPEQLGLVLKTDHAPVDMLVVEGGSEAPTGN